jgi:hypothetical protein
MRFGGLDERSPDTPTPKGRFHVPALDEWHWGRRATGCVFAVVQFQKSDELPIGLCHEDDRGLPIFEVLPCLSVVI